MLCQIVLFDGFDPLDVIAPYEVLFAGSMAAPGQLSVELVSAEGPREVPSGAGLLTLRATGRWIRGGPGCPRTGSGGTARRPRRRRRG
ncbi:ThiJ/PfpI, partial [Streptomyces sp. Mg1]